MNTARSIVGLLAAAGLAGCSAMYVAPTGGSTATLTVENKGSAVIAAQTYRTAVDCRDRLIIGSAEPGKTLVTRVAASGPVSITLGGQYGNRSCFVTGAFEPRPGGSYRLEYSADGQSCSMTLTDAATGGRYPMGHLRSLRGFSEAGPWCGPR